MQSIHAQAARSLIDTGAYVSYESADTASARNGQAAEPKSGTIRAKIAEWMRRARERSELMTLTHRDLRDIGMSRTDAVTEGNKPFWKG